MFIEEAAEMLRTVDPAVLADQRKELHVAHVGPGTEDFACGYEMGLQTARVVLMQSPKAAAAGVADLL
jgi:hypothetical protein